jgi:hypothetical protein
MDEQKGAVEEMLNPKEANPIDDIKDEAPDSPTHLTTGVPSDDGYGLKFWAALVRLMSDGLNKKYVAVLFM